MFHGIVIFIFDVFPALRPREFSIAGSPKDMAQ